MEPKKYIFDIANPCTENWDKMTTNDAGKFCNLCSKNVIDFTKLSDSQVIKIIQKSSGSVCGRMRVDQLNREMYPITEKTPKSFFYKILASTVLFFTSIKSEANSLRENFKSKTEISYNLNNSSKNLEENSIENDTIKGKTLKGKIIDKDRNPLENVKLKLEYSNIETKTDSMGKFEIFIPDSLMAISLWFEISDKYDTNTYFFYKKDFLKFNIIEFKSKNKLPKKNPRAYSFGYIDGVRIIGSSQISKKNESTRNLDYQFNQDKQIDTRPFKDR